MTALAAVLAVLGSSLLIAAPARADDVVIPVSDAPPAVAPAAPTITQVTGGLASGQLLVAYTPPVTDGGAVITSYDVSLDGGAAWWPCLDTSGTCTLTNLTNERTYMIWLRAVNAIGPGAVSATASGVPTYPVGMDPDKPAKLPKPRVWVNASFTAASNHLGVDGATTRLGVGTLPQLTFSQAIPNKRVVESHLFVTAMNAGGGVRKVKGAWGWLDDRTTVFRPMNYWPGRSTVSIRSTLDRAVLGKSGKNYLVGSDSLGRTYTFRTARKLIMKVDGSTDQMKVYLDGVKVKTFGVSLGKSEWETSNGVKVISTEKEPLHTYTSVALNIDPAVETPYELKDIPWNTRLAPTGEFIHSAPWAYGRIGRYNGSHGCTNMFESDAKWIYEKTIPGDVVIYTNTGGSVVQSWNGPGGLWNIPWATWLKKSALGSVTGNPDTADPSTAVPGGSTPQASA